MSNRLLLADGDPKSLRVLEVSLRNAGFQVSTAQSGSAAWDAIQRDTPAVIIADAELPEVDGVSVCARVREQGADRGIPFILLGTDKSVEARVRGLQAGADDYLVKPTYVNEVIARVRALVQRREREKLASPDAAPEAFEGKLSDITVVDLLELLATNKRSGIIHLHGPRGATAAVYFRQGVVIDAEVGRLSGADAIGRLFAWTEGTFSVEWKNIRRPDAIGRPTADLVLEGMKRLDQKALIGTDDPARGGVYELNYRVLADRLAEIPDEVNSILRLFDGSRRLAQVVEDSQIPDAEAMTVISRLRDEGIIVEVKSENGEAASDAVPQAVSGAGGNGRSGPAGGRAGASSGPVGQSFADRMRAGAGARAAAEASGSSPAGSAPAAPEPPPPPPTTTKTDRGFPQLDLLSATSPGSTDDDGPQGPSRGEANLELLNGGGEVEARDIPPERANDDNVIPFPMDGRASSGPREVAGAVEDESASPPATSDEMSPEELAALFGSTSAPDASPVDAANGSGPSSGETAAPKVPVSMLQTQRGFGLPPPPPPAPSSDVAPPPSPPEGSGHESSEHPAQPAPEDDPAASQAVASPALPGRMATGPGGVVMVSAVAEATAQYNDRDLSKREALDELGVPGRHRVLKVVAVALVLGAAGAVGVSRFRAHQPAGQVVTTADKSPAASAPAAPQAARSGETPPAAAAPSTAEPDKTAAMDLDKVDVKNPSAKPAGEKGVAAGAEKAAEGPAGGSADQPPKRTAERTAEKVAERATDKPTGKATEKMMEKAPSEARKSTDTEKSPAADTFRQQLADCHTLFSKNRFREASTACGAAVQSNPRSADALTMLAHVELNRGHMSRAYELAQKAIAIYPDQPDAYVIIGGVHQDGGRNEQAKAAYQRYLHLAPHGRYAVELRSIVGSL